ncbi:MAG: hypothetical protein HKN47_01590, partial [Pirellulaceae bacterium]|nr:hypothetical protein [Pirellulaceae bacterium]
MNRIATICALVLLVVSLGCRGDNPGTWTNDKVSAKMMESLNLTEITLSPDPSGGFSGTGKRADGETITVTVNQDADA